MSALLVSIVGLVDDVRGVSVVTRLAIHGLGASLLLAAVGTWRTLAWPGLGSVELGWLAIPFSAFVVVALTNAYNFMDGIDGIAGSQGAVAGVGWVGAGLLLEDPLLATAGAALAASSLGFLVFNWPPASIFMGDVGSSYIGFLAAALSVWVASRSPAVATAGLLFVWPFVFDTAFTLVRRMRRRENLLRAHRSHLYQRLVLTGVSHGRTTLLYTVLAIVGLAVGYFVAAENAGGSLAGAIVIGLLAIGLCAAVSRREREARAG